MTSRTEIPIERQSLNNLPFTGERFTPECLREMWYEHYHRYAFARALVKGRSVADIACGEGYGAMLLAQSAATVLGIDINEATVAHARERYATQVNLRFEQGDASQLALADASLDLITSFETIEHLEAQEALLAGFARVLKNDGILVISSPDKRTYSEERGYQNEFHVRELYREEFLSLLGRHFGHVRLFGQKLLFQSVIWSETPGRSAPLSAAVHTATSNASRIGDQLDYAPMYFIAVCTKHASAMPCMTDLDLFGDAEESVYRHYEHEIRKNMRAGTILQEAAAELDAERAAHEETRSQLADAQAQLQQLSTHPRTRPWWQRWMAKRE